MKYLLTAAAILAMPAFALAQMPAPTPGPLLGAVAGPWGLVAGVAAVGAFRFYKRRR